MARDPHEKKRDPILRHPPSSGPPRSGLRARDEVASPSSTKQRRGTFGETEPGARPAFIGANTGPLLEGPVIVATATADHRVLEGQVLIGRNPECMIRIAGDTVSRRHAMLHVRPDAVVIEDLNSQNGVYVGGERVDGHRRLRDGDRIIIGHRQLTVFSLDGRSRNATPIPEESAPPKPEDILPVETLRTKALDTLGRLADRMLAMGRIAEAERVLSEQLTRTLDGARVGMPVPEDLVRSASTYSLKLADAARRGHWLDYAAELHSRTGVAPTEAQLRTLIDNIRAVDRVDWTLLENLQATMAQSDDPAAQRCAEQLQRALLER